MTNRAVWAGRYAVFDELASGGMATVFLACRLGAGDRPRVVAVKKLFEQYAKQPEFVTMFLDEAHIAARIRHPNVVATHEFLRVPGSLAIVMDFVLGVSLLDLWAIHHDRGTFPPADVTATILCDVLEGLHAAHEAEDDRGQPFGLVHRDVSPHNVLVGKDGTSRVIDFGIAKAAGRLQITEAGVMKGKFAYMAPEQIRARGVDRRVDVYSSGIVLWEALTGRPLFPPNEDGLDGEQFVQRGTRDVPPPLPSSLNPDVPPGFDSIVRRALAFDPERRFSTAREMADALRDVTELAPSGAVAAWVSELAGSRLRELEAKRNEVEAAYATGELAALEGGLSPTSRPPPTFDVPDLLPVPSARVKELRPPAAAPPSTSAAAVVRPAAPLDTIDLAVDLTVPASMDLPPRPSARLGGGGAVRARRARRSSRIGGVAFVVVLLLAAAGAARFLGPSAVRSALANGARARGLVVSFDRMAPASGGLVLSGVTASLIGVTGATLTASDVALDVDSQGVHGATVAGFELVLRGDATSIAESVTAWRKEPHRSIAVRASAGHLVWTDVVARGIQIEGLGVALTVGTPEEGGLHVETSSATVAMPRGSLGPWSLRIDSSADETAVTVGLDRSKPGVPPQMTLVARPDVGTVLSVVVPRTRLVQIGVPVDLLNAGADPEVDIGLEGQVMPTGSPVTAHAKVRLIGLPGVAPGGAPADILLDGSISGAPSLPLHIDSGTLTVGKLRTRLTGVVTLTPEGVRAEVDRPSARAASSTPFVFDTRDWTQQPAKPPASAAARTTP